MEIHYVLMTFGIPTNLLPVTVQGEVAWEHHYDWISSRTSIEAKNLEAKEEEQIPLSDETNKDDSSLHSRRTETDQCVDDYHERYDTCETSIEKTIIASAIVIKVKEHGGLFSSRKTGKGSSLSLNYGSQLPYSY